MLSPAPDESGFPLGGGAEHTASVPFARALGAQWLGLRAAGQGVVVARLLLPCRPAVCDSRGTIDRRAIVALLDHSGAPACYGGKVATAATATLDLRVDFVGTARPGQDIVVESSVVAADGRSALVSSEAVHAEDRAVVARMSGRYVVGLGPGRANDSSESAEARSANAARYASDGEPAARSFDELLGGHLENGRLLLPFRRWLVGSVALPALHGGVVAAGLMSAAEALPGRPPGLRLASLSLSFLRPGQATDTRFESRVLKGGARAAHSTAEATQQDGTRVVSVMQALYA